MQIPGVVRTFLDKEKVGYQIVSQPAVSSVSELAATAGLSLSTVARAVFVSAGDHLLMVVIPHDRQVNLESLRSALHLPFELAPASQYEGLCEGCSSDVMPAMGRLLRLPTVVDEALREMGDIYLEAGNHTALIKVGLPAFMALQDTTVTFAVTERPKPSIADDEVYHLLGTVGVENQGLDMPPLLDIKSRIAFLDQLPSMPSMAAELIRLRNRPTASVGELARVIGRDPSLAAQLMKSASASVYGYGKRVSSLEEAVSMVLGFDNALHMAMGISIGRAFRNPLEGPFGLHAFWRKSLYTANLVDLLVKQMPAGSRPQSGLAYLSGLLHDFGFLLFGHLFPQEFAIFNRIVAEQPDEALSELEKQMLGLSHGEIASWLMRSWGLPEVVIVAIQEHHNESYQGEHAIYARLVLLADRLLARNGFVDTDKAVLPVALLDACHLDQEKIESVIDQLFLQGGAMDELVSQLVA